MRHGKFAGGGEVVAQRINKANNSRPIPWVGIKHCIIRIDTTSLVEYQEAYKKRDFEDEHTDGADAAD